jgi:cell division protein FtsL
MNLIERRVRGFRLIDLIAVGVLATLVLGVYLAKTMAGAERTQIAKVERQISAEKARIRLLQAEVSHLEQPARIERLAQNYLGLGPVSIRRETTADALAAVATKPVAAPAAPPEPTPDPTAVEAPAPTPKSGEGLQ